MKTNIKKILLISSVLLGLTISISNVNANINCPIVEKNIKIYPNYNIKINDLFNKIEAKLSSSTNEVKLKFYMNLIIKMKPYLDSNNFSENSKIYTIFGSVYCKTENIIIDLEKYEEEKLEIKFNDILGLDTIQNDNIEEKTTFKIIGNSENYNYNLSNTFIDETKEVLNERIGSFEISTSKEEYIKISDLQISTNFLNGTPSYIKNVKILNDNGEVLRYLQFDKSTSNSSFFYIKDLELKAGKYTIVSDIYFKYGNSKNFKVRIENIIPGENNKVTYTNIDLGKVTLINN